MRQLHCCLSAELFFAYQKYASTFNNASNGNVSLNSINEGMSYTILDDGTNVYENPDKGSAVLMQTKANETVSFLALAHGGFYKIRVNGRGRICVV